MHGYHRTSPLTGRATYAPPFEHLYVCMYVCLCLFYAMPTYPYVCLGFFSRDHAGGYPDLETCGLSPWLIRPLGLDA